MSALAGQPKDRVSAGRYRGCVILPSGKDEADRPPPANDASSLAFAGALAQARMVRRGEIPRVELTQLYPGRIERLDPSLNEYWRT